MKTALAAAGMVLVLLGGGALWGWKSYQDFLAEPLDIPDPGYVLQVEAGASGRAIIEELARQGITEAGWPWRLLMRLEPAVIKAGEYRLEGGLLPRGLLALLASGKVIQYRFTIVEGWTYRQLVEALRQNEILRHELDAGAPPIEDPEGWYLPETYLFSRGDSDVDILEWAHKGMQAALEEAWAGRSASNPLETPYELLILASIIEKETADETERGRIAGVFTRRLKKGMRLQTDPTVIYGLGENFDGDLRRRDLETDTPYNTYTRAGLPPTPIALPGKDSLMAAARPEEGEALFFVADGRGGHTFSATLEEHQAAVRKLLEGK